MFQDLHTFFFHWYWNQLWNLVINYVRWHASPFFGVCKAQICSREFDQFCPVGVSLSLSSSSSSMTDGVRRTEAPTVTYHMHARIYYPQPGTVVSIAIVSGLSLPFFFRNQSFCWNSFSLFFLLPLWGNNAKKKVICVWRRGGCCNCKLELSEKNVFFFVGV